MTTSSMGSQTSFGFVFLADDCDDNVVVADGRSRGDDPYVVNSAALDGDQLTIEASYGGGLPHPRLHPCDLGVVQGVGSRAAPGSARP